MTKCKIKDIVLRVKDKVSLDCGLKYYVGGEHFDNGEVLVKKHGDIQGSTIGPAFHMRFHPNQVLLMSRNPHLRKAGMVDFEGICSDVSYVCETRDEQKFKQQLLPFLFQSDKFWTMAEQNKRGSTNFFLNWSDFEEFEMNIPAPSKQEKLCTLLWQMENTKQAYKNLLQKTDDMVRAKFEEMFENDKGERLLKKQWTDVVNIINGKDHKEISGNGPYAVYGTGGKMMPATEYMCDAGTIIMGRKGTIDKPYIVSEKCWVVDTAFGVNPKDPAILNPIYLYQCIKRIDFSKLNKACTLPSVTKSDLLKLWITIPPKKLQEKFVEFVQQVNRSKQQLQKSLDSLNAMMRALVNQSFN